MKKVALLLACAFAAITNYAQLTLTGTSYSQNFDNISGGLPTGWEVYSGATNTSLGTAATFSGTQQTWNNTSGAFKNLASADGLNATSTTGDQNNSTDRALGVRQTGSFGDPGAAFVLHLSNTTGLSNFTLNFKLQSLDVAITRSVTWEVDYGFGATPSSFTSIAATGTMTTGNSTFSSNNISVNFGNALDNQSGDVWIRIVALTASTGSGARPTTALDDVMMNWTGSGTSNNRPAITALTPADNSLNVPVSTNNLTITFDRQIQKGTGDIRIVNENSQAIQTIQVTSSNVTVSGNTATINGVSLVQNTMYHVLFDSTAFDTAGFKSYGIYDTTTWNFMTEVGVLTSLNEMFDAACATGNLPAGWSKQNISGPSQEWICAGTTDKYMQMNGFASGANDNEDWLITPQLNFTNTTNPMLHFKAYKGFTGSDLQVLYSTSYSGSGDPNAVSWTNLNVNFQFATTSWADYNASLPMQQLHIAFKYNCTQAGNDCAQWRVDSVVTTGVTHIFSAKANNQMPLTILGNATSTQINLAFTMEKAGIVKAAIYDLQGRELYSSKISAKTGNNHISLTPSSLTSGIYLIRISNAINYGVAKVVVK